MSLVGQQASGHHPIPPTLTSQFIYFKVNVPNLVFDLNHTPMFELSGVWLGVYLRMNIKKMHAEKKLDYVLLFGQSFHTLLGDL